MRKDNYYKKWPYNLSWSWTRTFARSNKAVGVWKLPFSKQVEFYIRLGLTSQQTFEAMLYHHGGKAIRLAVKALDKMGDD